MEIVKTRSGKQEANKRFEDLLHKHALRITQPRLRVLELISRKNTATSQPDLEKVLGNDIDRVTLYRILNSFELKGILHKILDLNGTATYALCSEDCPEHIHQESHVHFTCSVCNSIYCLNEIKLPPVQLPKDFSMESVAVNVVGICAQCRLTQV